MNVYKCVYYRFVACFFFFALVVVVVVLLLRFLEQSEHCAKQRFRVLCVCVWEVFCSGSELVEWGLTLQISSIPSTKRTNSLLVIDTFEIFRSTSWWHHNFHTCRTRTMASFQLTSSLFFFFFCHVSHAHWTTVTLNYNKLYDHHDGFMKCKRTRHFGWKRRSWTAHWASLSGFLCVEIGILSVYTRKQPKRKDRTCTLE